MRKKIKETQNEIEKVQQKIQNTEDYKKNSINNKNERELETRILKEYTADLVTDLEQAKTTRQLHFERLLIQQKKICLYNDLLLSRKPFRLFKKESQLVEEYRKQKTLNENLILIVDILKEKFPNYFHEFQGITNTLLFYN